MELIAVLFFGGYVAFLFFICRRNYRNSGRCLRYGITDIWAIIIGLTPSLALVSYMIKHSQVEMVPSFMLLGLGQVAGIFLAMLENVDSKRASSAGSFVNIVAGAIAGVGLPIIYVAFVLITIFIVVLLGMMIVYTYGLVLLPILLLTYTTIRKRKQPGA